MTVKERRPRRQISDQEFRKAYYGDPADGESMKAATDNRNVIGGVLRRYAHQIHPDDLSTIGMTALWRCLQYHRPEFKQKLTTSLHRFTLWECNREIAKMDRRPPTVSIHEGNLDFYEEEPTEQEESIEHIKECIDLVDCGDSRKLLRQYYIQGLTLVQIGRLNGYSKTTAGQYLADAVRMLRAICYSDLGVSTNGGEVYGGSQIAA